MTPHQLECSNLIGTQLHILIPAFSVPHTVSPHLAHERNDVQD